MYFPKQILPDEIVREIFKFTPLKGLGINYYYTNAAIEHIATRNLNIIKNLNLNRMNCYFAYSINDIGMIVPPCTKPQRQPSEQSQHLKHSGYSEHSGHSEYPGYRFLNIHVEEGKYSVVTSKKTTYNKIQQLVIDALRRII